MVRNTVIVMIEKWRKYLNRNGASVALTNRFVKGFDSLPNYFLAANLMIIDLTKPPQNT